MERLTRRNEYGQAYLFNVEGGEQVIEGTPNVLRCLCDSMQRLGDYEDLGLTPEEIKNLLHDGGVSIAMRNRRYKDALESLAYAKVEDIKDRQNWAKAVLEGA